MSYVNMNNIRRYNLKMNKFKINLTRSDSQYTLAIVTPVAMPGVKTYEELPDKPSINEVVLTGNKNIMDLFPDGIIVNCGNAAGYPEIIIPEKEV